MSFTNDMAWHAPRRARWMDLVSAACALTLALVLAVYSAAVRPLESTPEPNRKASVSAGTAANHERLFGVHDPSPHERLEVPRSGGKLPQPKRFTPRVELAARWATLPAATHTRWVRSYALPPAPGRIANRPIIANCPAQGPPRTA